MLEIKDLRTFHGRKIEALKGVSLSINPGEIVTLIGANGAGKSTLLKSIAGLLVPDSGEIWFEGQMIKHKPPHHVVALGIVYVPEGRRVFPRLTVLENLLMGAYLRRDRSSIAEDQERMMTLFPILRDRQKQMGSTLSGGEQQMLAMARALMARPKVLMLDEPSMEAGAAHGGKDFLDYSGDPSPGHDDPDGGTKLAQGAGSRAARLCAGNRQDRPGRVRPSPLNNAQVKHAYLGIH